MSETVVIAMAEFGTQLQGRVAGRRAYAKICERLAEVPAGEIVLLDFAGVDLVTGSWANAALVPLIRWAAEDQNDLFPILCNAGEDCIDDLELVAEWHNQCYLLAQGTQDPPETVTLVGSLDPAQQQTLQAALEMGRITGAELERQAPPEDGTRLLAGTYRLKDLHSKRLLRRQKQGREQIYSPVASRIVFAT